MLIRVGLLNFETIADFTVAIMKKWVYCSQSSSFFLGKKS